MLIKIDCREIKLFELCKILLAETNDIKLVSESLPLGDIIICDDLGVENVIIERKSIADLASSIRDGRYTEQSYRLNNCEMHNHQIYYLIEGDLRYYKPFKGLPDKKAILSSMISIGYYKGFSLYRTNNLDETAEWIIHFATKLLKEGTKMLPFYSGGSSKMDEKTYTEVVAKRVKKDNITPQNIGEIMLSQIPNVSNASAIAIMNKFSTITKLMDALNSSNDCLNDICITNKNNQSKKLTKPCINNIYLYLLNKTDNITIET